jgi:hypothetical protein
VAYTTRELDSRVFESPAQVKTGMDRFSDRTAPDEIIMLSILVELG